MKAIFAATISAALSISATAALVRAADPATTQPAMTATATEISESRSRELVKSEFPMSYGNDLIITLKISGPGADAATAYGMVTIDLAADDAGDNLIPPKNTFFGRGDDMTTIADYQRKMWKDGGLEGIEATVSLAQSARKATTLTEVKGHLIVRTGGTEQVVTVAEVPSMEGKSLDDPALKAAGLTVKVSAAKANSTSITLDLTGPLSNLSKVELLGPGGKDLINGSGVGTAGIGREQGNYLLTSPLDATMTLRIHAITGQKDVTVPFDLKDVPLP